MRTPETMERIRKGNIPDELLNKIFSMESEAPASGKMIFGTCEHKENGKPTGEVSKIYNFSRYKFFIKAPFTVSERCCSVMKKTPIHNYAKRNGRVGITAQMASESKLRTKQWLQHGCNAFDKNHPISNPMSFWTEQDVLLYLYDRKIPIAKCYGEIVKENDIDGQLDFEDLGLFDLGTPCLTTTGCKRTGCMFCGYGAHLEKPGEGRFERLRVTHPKQYDYIMRPKDQGGLGYKEVIDWINVHGDLHIRY